MTPILCLDLATTTGWAALRANGQVVSGAARIAPPKAPVGEFACLFGRWLTELVIQNAPEMIVFEAPFVGDRTAQATARKLIGLAVLTELHAYTREIECFERPYRSVVKHFTGSGGGKRDEIKARVVAACEARGWRPESQDEADALALLWYARHCIGDPAAAPPGLFLKVG